VVQHAALAALELTDGEMKPTVEAFRRRRERMREIFSACPHLSFLSPAGAFYFFLKVERVYGAQYNHDGIIANSDDLAFFLLNAYHVSTVAGSGFGAPGYLRLSFACADADVEEGSKRIVEAVNKLAALK
jgi:aspartate aminotransferase